jgi:hypothetical protein
VCPSSLVATWHAEVLKFFPPTLLVPVLFSGSDSSALQQEGAVVIVSFTALRQHVSLLRNQLFEIIVVDEAHIIKNSATAAAQAVFMLRSRGMRIALSGTPVWAFHGANDSILPVLLSDASVAALRATGRRAPLKYTRIDSAPGADYAWQAAGVPEMEGHASWVNAYYPPGSEPTEIPLYAWLLSFRRPPGAASSIEEAWAGAYPRGGPSRRAGVAHGGRGGRGGHNGSKG